MKLDLDRIRKFAQRLSPLITDSQLEKMRDQMARRFFGEGGVPPHLKEGWAALEQRVKEREAVGYPMPPGGCFILGREATIAGCLADMHMYLARVMNMEASRIKLRIEQSPEGHLIPLMDVDPPDNWVIPIRKLSGDIRADMSSYFEKTFDVANQWFREAAVARLKKCEMVREDVHPTVTYD
jgi:hypothetical protein